MDPPRRSEPWRAFQARVNGTTNRPCLEWATNKRPEVLMMHLRRKYLHPDIYESLYRGDLVSNQSPYCRFVRVDITPSTDPYLRAGFRRQQICMKARSVAYRRQRLGLLLVPNSLKLVSVDHVLDDLNYLHLDSFLRKQERTHTHTWLCNKS